MKNKKDLLWWVEQTDFKPLDDVKVSMLNANFTNEEIEETLLGLLKLPEYKNIPTVYNT